MLALLCYRNLLGHSLAFPPSQEESKMFFLNNKLQLQKLMGKYLWSDCSLFFLPAWSPGVSLFLQAFLRGHRIGIQQIRHCICTKSHFFNHLHHQSVNATPPQIRVYILYCLFLKIIICQLIELLSSLFIFCFFGFSQMKQTVF